MSARILLGVSGGIAAYKACTLLRLLTESGHDVRVVPTPAALRFVGTATWEALSGHPVRTEVWEDVPDVPHVGLGRWADLVVVAPASADLISRAATGRADDLLTASLLTATCPVLVAPAMHTEMWQHPATQANVATLRSRGITVVDPDVGRLTGADSGAGRLPEPADIAAAALALLAPRDLEGRRVLVTAGGTREPLDPVRYLGNRSSGRQGVALAERARDRGARVTLIAAHLEVPAPAGVEVVEVSTAAHLAEEVAARAPAAEVVVMAAAVADFRPAAPEGAKIKKAPGRQPPEIRLEQTEDVLAGLVARRRSGAAPTGQVIVGFAAETGDDDGDVLAHGTAKLRAKGCDLLVVNDVSAGRVFGRAETEAVILDARGGATEVPAGSKGALADAVWSLVAARLRADA